MLLGKDMLEASGFYLVLPDANTISQCDDTLCFQSILDLLIASAVVRWSGLESEFGLRSVVDRYSSRRTTCLNGGCHGAPDTTDGRLSVPLKQTARNDILKIDRKMDSHISLGKPAAHSLVP